MNKKIEFPGYSEKVKKAEQKAQKREQRKEEKRKNALPPFLMVRGGLLNEALIAALITIPLAECVFGRYTKQNTLAAFVYVGLYVVPFVIGALKAAVMSHEKNIIKQDIDYYSRSYEPELPSIKKYECEHMAEIMARYASKNNPKFFENLIENPTSVKDEKMASAIIRGHIKSHPEDIQKVLDTFTIGTIPNKLYQQLRKCKAR